MMSLRSAVWVLALLAGNAMAEGASLFGMVEGVWVSPWEGVGAIGQLRLQLAREAEEGGEDRAGLQELDDAFLLVAIRARAAYKSQLAFVQAVLAAGGDAGGEDAGKKAAPELEAAARALLQKEYSQSYAAFLVMTGWGQGEMAGELPPLPPLLECLAGTPGCMAEMNGHAELACQWALAQWEQTRAVIGECLQDGSSLLFPQGAPDEGQMEELLLLFRRAEADWRLWMEAVGYAVSPCSFFRGTGTPWTVYMVQVYLLVAHGDYLTGLLALHQEGEG